MTKIYVFVSCFFIMICTQSRAYSYLPIVKSYDKKEYKAGRQNWAIGTDSYGVVYFGNSNGLLRNVYGKWHLSETSSKDVVRSLCVNNDTIWTSGDVDLGFFVKDSPGDMRYERIGDVKGGTVWDIQVLNDFVYFQSEGLIMVYDKKLKTTSTINDERGFFGITVWNNQLWVVNRGEKLGVIQNSKFVEKITIENVNGVEIRKLFIHQSQLHILMFDGRIFSYDGTSLIQKELPETIAGKPCFTACSYDEQTYCIGTISDGMLMINDNTGEIITTVNSQSELIDNTVLAIQKVTNGNVWLGLDYGIALLEHQNAIKPIFDKGATYFLEEDNNTTYLATNKGLYFSSSDAPFQMLKGSEGQIWRLRKVNDNFFVCHNRGLFLLKNNKLIQQIEGVGVLDIAHFEGTNYYLISTYLSLQLVRFEDGKMTIFDQQEMGAGLKLAYDPVSKCIWADSPSDSPLCLTYSDELKLQAKSYPEIVSFFNTEDGLFFYNGNRLMVFQNNDFVAVERIPLNSIVGEGLSALIVEKGGNRVAFIKNGVPDLLVSLFDGSFYSYEKLLVSTQKSLIKQNEFIKFHNGDLLLATDRGVLAFKTENSAKSKISYPLVISNVQVTFKDSEPIEYIYPYKKNLLELSKGDKDIRFSFGISLLSSDFAEFRYQLSPYDSKWSDWSSASPEKGYTKLKGGNYTFYLQSRINGTQIKEQSLNFEIAKYWYQTNLVLLPVFIVFAFLIFVGFQILTRINRARMRKEIEDHKLQATRDSIKMKNEQLLQYTEVISRKNEFLLSLKDSLSRMRNTESKLLENRILEEVNSEKKNFFFHKLFSEVHQDFIARLSKAHPELSAHDVRILSFIRINLGNKEIANLMNISPKSVDINRYRIRKKLNLDHDTDLNKYIREQ